MKENMLAIQESKEARSYLEDTSDQRLLSSFREFAGSNDGLSEIHLSSVIKKGILHNSEGLSPAGGIAIANDGRIFISDEFNHRICVYDSNGENLKTFGAKGAKNGEFNYPRGLALDNSGNLYVADAWNHRISVFSEDLTFKAVFGKLGAGKGELDEPVSLIIRGEFIYVLEKANHRIQVFTLDGTPEGIIGGRGSLDEQRQFYMTKKLGNMFPVPAFEYPSALTEDKDGNLFIADTNNHRVVKISNSTRLPDTSFNLTGIRFPSGLICDSEGNLHLTQFNINSVSVYSPEGLHLYSYKPGMEVPVAIASRDNLIFVSDGINSSVSFMELEPKHDKRLNLENRFMYHIKSAMKCFSAGDTGEAIKHLADCASSSDKLSPETFGELLPQNDYLFALSNEPVEIEKTRLAEPFAEMLKSFSSELLESTAKTILDKSIAVEEFSNVMLRLENSFHSGKESSDDIMVEKYQILKKIYSYTTSLSKQLSSFKKIEEFALRVSFAGIGIKIRLQTMRYNLDTLLTLRQTREEWHRTAEKEAPGLNFSSSSAQRTLFVQSFNKIEMLSWEFNLLSDLITDQNYELASLSAKFGLKDEDELKNIVINSLDFLAVFPETTEKLQIYFRSLNMLLSSVGPKTVKEIIKPFDKDEYWSPLKKEENIICKRGASFSLLGALWTDGGFNGSSAMTDGAWDKISSFYHGEFDKYEKEHAPLISETLRLAFQLPTSEKTDPKHSIEVRNKLSLLNFHKYYQERYTCSMIKEYSLRYALLKLAEPGLPEDAVRKSAHYIQSFLSNWISTQHTLGDSLNKASLNAQKEKDLQKKNSIKIEAINFENSFVYRECLSAFFSKLIITSKQNQPDNHLPKLAVSYFGYGGTPVLASKPVSIIGKDARFFVISALNSKIHSFNADGNWISTFSGYGNSEGLLNQPTDITISPEGNLGVLQIDNSVLTFFTIDGRYVKRILLETPSSRDPLRVRIDSKGNIYTSFLDGKGFGIFNSNGKFLREIKRESLGLHDNVNLLGFEIDKDHIITGGQGSIIMADLDGKVAKTLNSTNLLFKDISSITTDSNGDFLATNHLENQVLQISRDLSRIEALPDLESEAAVSAYRMDGTTAILDYSSNTVQLYKLK